MNMEDITEEFFTICKERLDLGEVVTMPGYNLADAMSAIEIMDPKMDIGMQPFDENLGLDYAIQTGKIDVSNVELKDLIAVIDATMAMVVSWLHCQPLDQTVLTNICLLGVDKIKDPILAGFCSAALNFVYALKSCIEMANVYREEDFVSFSCKLDMNEAYRSSVDELDTAIEIIRTRKTDKTAIKLVEAVECRLCLWQALFEIFSHLMPSSQNASANLRKAGLAVERALACVDVALATIRLGTQPASSSAAASDEVDEGDFSWLPYFQPNLNRHLLPPSFPRAPKTTRRVDALKYLNEFLFIMKRMIAELPDRIRDIEGLMDFFQLYGDSQGTVLTRSFAQLLVMPHNTHIFGVYPLNRIIFDSIRQSDTMFIGENAQISLLNNESLQEQLNTFVQYCKHAFLNIFQMFGHNVARQRDKFLRNCLEDLGALLTEANEIEKQHALNLLSAEGSSNTELDVYSPISRPLTNFVIYYALRLMHYHFHLGFQLDLFVPYEFNYVYWYMGNIATNHLSSVLERRCNITVLMYSHNIATLKTKKSGRKQQLRQRAEAELSRTIARMQAAIIRLKLENYLCQAYAKFATAQRASGRLTTPCDESHEAIRYAQRFDAFVPLSSAPVMLSVPYEFFQSFTKSESPPDLAATFREAASHFDDAVNFLRDVELRDSLNESWQRLARTAKQNAIVSRLLAASPNLKKKVVFDRDDPSFPLIKLV